MNNPTKHIISFLLFQIMMWNCYSQQYLSLEDVLKLAKENSMEYQEDQKQFIVDFMSYRHYKLSMLPKISFNANPLSYNRSITQRYDYENNIETYRESSTLNSNVGLNISQKVPVTGGNLTLNSSLSRLENLGDANQVSFSSSPMRISYSQPLFTHNAYRWEKQEIPLKLKQAKMRLIQAEQVLNQKAAQLFFALLKTSQLYELAKHEIENTKELLAIGKEQLAIHTITPNELVELELKLSNANVTLLQSEQELLVAKYELGKLIRSNINQDIMPILNDSIPEMNLSPVEVLTLTKLSNPFYLKIEQERINLNRNIDRQEKQNKFNANINVSYGLNQAGSTIPQAYENPSNQQSGSISLSIPFIDWGTTKDDLLLARMEMKMNEIKIETRIEDFEQNVIRKVFYSQQNKKMIVHGKNAKELSQKAYSTKIEQYKLGQITLRELNQSQADLLNAKENYLENLSNYWTNYFELQEITLHNLSDDFNLNTDFDALIKAFYNR